MIHQLRQIKSEEETALIRQAIHKTALGIDAAFRVCKPGAFEYEVQAAIEYQIRKNGAERTSFPSIIGSGANALSPHYDKNYCQMAAGGMVVMDVGAEYHGYAADITRTIPVNGRFSREQAIVYGEVLKVQQSLIRMVRPGMTFGEIETAARKLITDAGYGKYILHGVSHPLGLDVHDVSTGDTLRAGMVITIEPGIYIPVDDTILKKGFRTTGVRVEDDILVTNSGFEILSAEIPKEMAEIEKRMRD